MTWKMYWANEWLMANESVMCESVWYESIINTMKIIIIDNVLMIIIQWPVMKEIMTKYNEEIDQ